MAFNRLGASALLTGSVLTGLVFLFHPNHLSERDMTGIFSLSQIIHAAAIVAAPLSLFGLWELSRWIGRPLAQLGLVFVAIAMVLTVNAAVISSFVMPAAARASGIVHPMMHVPAPPGAAPVHHVMDVSQMPPLIQLAVAMNRGLAQAHVALLSIALLLFGLALWTRSRLVALAGAVIGVGALLWQLSGQFSPETGTMPFIVFPECAWLIAAAAMMARAPTMKGSEA